MLPKTLTVLSAISLNNTSPNKNYPNKDINPGMSSPCQAPLLNMKDQEVMAERPPPLSKKRKPLKSPSLSQGLSKKDKFPHQNSEGITTEVTFLSELITKALT